MKSKVLSRRIPTKLYESFIIPVLSYGVSALTVLKRKVLCKIHCPLCVVTGKYHRRIDKNTPALKVVDAVSADRSRGIGRSPLCWKDQVKKNLAELGISNWLQTQKRRKERRTVDNLSGVYDNKEDPA